MRNQVPTIPFMPGKIALVVAPPHMIRKWQRELSMINPHLVTEELETIHDIHRFMDAAADSSAPHVGLIRRDMIKLGCRWTPAIQWRTTGIPRWRPTETPSDGYDKAARIAKVRVPHCPTCGCAIVLDKDDANNQPHYINMGYPTEKDFTNHRRTCNECHAPLWREMNDPRSSALSARYALSIYLKLHYPDRIRLLVWDEAHEGKYADTGNGAAMSRPANLADLTLLLTGTPFDGKASGSFNTMYLLNKQVRQEYPIGGGERVSRKERGAKRWAASVREAHLTRTDSEQRWVANMGILEKVLEERPTYDSETGVFTGTREYERPYEETVGISPKLPILSLNSTIFFSLRDMSDKLPDYEEIPVPVNQDPTVAHIYETWMTRLKDYLIERRWEGDVSFRGVRRVAA